MLEVMALSLDSQSPDQLAYVWGVQSPVYPLALEIFSETISVQFQQGLEFAFDALTESVNRVCLDGDVANFVNSTRPGDSDFVTACVDGLAPGLYDPPCVG